MDTIYQASFLCHGCGLENTFTFLCGGDYFEASRRASTFSCPSGCNPQRTAFELTNLNEVEWETVVDATGAVFH